MTAPPDTAYEADRIYLAALPSERSNLQTLRLMAEDRARGRSDQAEIVDRVLLHAIEAQRERVSAYSKEADSLAGTIADKLPALLELIGDGRRLRSDIPIVRELSLLLERRTRAYDRHGEELDALKEMEAAR